MLLQQRAGSQQALMRKLIGGFLSNFSGQDHIQTIYKPH